MHSRASNARQVRTVFAAIAVFVVFTVFSQAVNSVWTLEMPSGQGVSWMYFPDGDGIPQVVLLNSTGQSTRLNYENYISFQLYTKAKPEKGETIELGDVLRLQSSNFKPELPTKFVVHGWKSSGRSDAMQRIKTAYIASGDLNVIIVNWEELSSSYYYLGPVANTQPVGKHIGKMITFLVKRGGSRHDLIHLVGHSLGAHVAGFAGASLAPEKVARITGLDPASPGFSHSSELDQHLDTSDAHFVDVIHTCGGILGYASPLGHVDFYPNGGTSAQPGCCCLPLFMEACSHSRAHELFAESIRSPRGFAARKCPSWTLFKRGLCPKSTASNSIFFMGDEVNNFKSSTNSSGIYYLETRHSSPYALG